MSRGVISIIVLAQQGLLGTTERRGGFNLSGGYRGAVALF